MNAAWNREVVLGRVWCRLSFVVKASMYTYVCFIYSMRYLLLSQYSISPGFFLPSTTPLLLPRWCIFMVAQLCVCAVMWTKCPLWNRCASEVATGLWTFGWHHQKVPGLRCRKYSWNVEIWQELCTRLSEIRLVLRSSKDSAFMQTGVWQFLQKYTHLLSKLHPLYPGRGKWSRSEVLWIWLDPDPNTLTDSTPNFSTLPKIIFHSAALYLHSFRRGICLSVWTTEDRFCKGIYPFPLNHKGYFHLQTRSPA